MKQLIKFIFKQKQLLTYGVIGCVCAGIDFSVYTLLAIKFTITYLFANIISVHCGILSSFFLNRHITFNIKDKMMVRLLIFYIVGLFGLLISSGLLYMLIEQLHQNTILSKGFTIILVALIQFTLNKFITFQKK